MLRLSLLRSPEWPDPHADEGHHEFTYSLYPHGGGWRDALTVRRGYELNYPLIAIAAQPHAGPLPPTQSLFSADAENVVISSIKKEEDGDSLSLRFYEWAGRKTDVHLSVPAGLKVGEETNLIENAGNRPSSAAGGQTAVVTVNPYEIKTVRLDRVQ